MKAWSSVKPFWTHYDILSLFVDSAEQQRAQVQQMAVHDWTAVRQPYEDTG